MGTGKPVIIQERINQVLNEEFTKLLKENEEDLLLKFLINDELENYSIEQLKELLPEVK
jgi:predicted transcriptional regulator